MAELHHTWNASDVFQAGGTTASWDWPVGEREHYWGFSVRPFQFNDAGVEVLRQWTSSGNTDGSFVEHFDVRHSSNALMRFSAIWVVG
jgi:hypothetical protein